MYNFDQTAARKGDERSGRISEIGPYVGRFTRVEPVVSEKKGTKGVEFAFESDDKQGAVFTLWTLNNKGEQLFGYGQLQAVMTVLRCRSIALSPAMVRKYDRNSNGLIDVQAEVFADLMNKPVGVLFETEDYEKTNGGVGVKVVFAGVYEAKTKLTASEILDKKVQPQKYEQHVRTLKHRALKNAPRGGNMGHPNAPGNGGGFDDDEIPF